MITRELADAIDRALEVGTGSFLVSGSGSVLGLSRENGSRVSDAGTRFEDAQTLKLGDSLDLVRRVDFGLGVVEVVDRATFEGTTEIRIDRVLAFEDPDTGFLRVDARLARTGVLQYADRNGDVWGELVDEDELFNPESMKSFELVVLTDDHPEKFVSVENVRDVQVGHVGSDVRRDGRYLRATILITDAPTIAKAKAGKLELSCGYTAAARLERGVRDGSTYRYRQLRRRGNHVSIVDRGRAGPECRLLLDSTSAATHWKENNMDKKKIKIDGVEFELPAEIADAIEAGRKDKTKTIRVGDAEFSVPVEVADAFEKEEEEEEEEMDGADKPKPKPSTKTTDSSSELERLRGKNDALEAELQSMKSGESTRIDARVSLVSHAKTILGPEFVTDGKSNAAIKAAIVNKVQPDRKVDAAKVSEGYLDGRFEGALQIHDRAEGAADENSRVLFDAMNGQAPDGDLDPIAAYDSYMQARTRPAKKGA